MELTLTFEGLLEYDANLFASLSLPASVDRSAVISAIVLKGTDRCVLWPSPDAMKGALAAYSAMRLSTWEKMATALAISYEPLENYDRREEGSYKDSHSGTIKNTGTSTDETSVSAYDATTYQPRAKEVTTPDLTMTDTTASERTFNQYRIHGNIGVTTSQQMLESEMELRSKWNLIEYIANEIVSEFTFGVY